MKKMTFLGVTFAIVLLLFWSLAQTESSNAQNRVPPAEGKTLVFLSLETKKQLEDEAIFLKTDQNIDQFLSYDELQQSASEEKVLTIIIDSNVLEKVEADWLREQYEQGIIVGGINVHPDRFKTYLGLPVAQAYELPPFITSPYLYYKYDKSVQYSGDWGSGIFNMAEFSDFMSFVKQVDENHRLN